MHNGKKLCAIEKKKKGKKGRGREKERNDSEMRWYEFLTMTPFSKVKTNSLFDYSSFLLASSLIKALSLQKKNQKKKQQKEFTISFYYVFNSLAHEHKIVFGVSMHGTKLQWKNYVFLIQNLYTPKFT